MKYFNVGIRTWYVYALRHTGLHFSDSSLWSLIILPPWPKYSQLCGKPLAPETVNSLTFGEEFKPRADKQTGPGGGGAALLPAYGARPRNL